MFNNSNKEMQYNEYIKQYNHFTDAELKEITIENGCLDVAVKAANTILKGRENTRKIEKLEATFEENKKLHPLHESIEQLTKSINTIKYIIIFEFLCGIIGAIIVFANMFGK